MADRKKVVRAVETCFDSWIDKHRNMGLDLHEVERMKRDALELLKEQEPRVMKLEEIRMREVYWVEQENVSRPWPIAMHHIRTAGLLEGPVYQDYMGDNYNTKEYGKTWRCWTARPTDEQMEEVERDA